MMSVTGIHGQMLEVTVVGCSRLKDTEWISRQDPYVCLEYGSTKFRTRTCTDGNKNPTFQEKFTFSLIEGLREINVVVWNSNTLSYDDFIGSGKVQIQKVLSQGFDDTPWTIQSKSGKYAGEVRLIMHYSNANKPMTSGYAPSAPQYYAAPQVPLYSAPPPAAALYPPTMASFTTPSAYPSYPSAYPPSPYPPQPSAYPPQSSAYPPQTYPPQTYPPQTYPPQSYPQTYPPQTYPPQPYPPQSYPPNPYQTYPPPY